jgi:DNA primase large subunit
MQFQRIGAGSGKRKSEGETHASKRPKLEEIGKGYYSMYRYRPTKKTPLSIDKFEEATLKRMKLLAKLYELDGRKAGEGFIEQAKTIVGQPQFQFRDTLGEGEKKEPFDEDSISHFALRLGLCISERWRQWFVKYELLLFKVRMSALVARQQQMLLQMNNIQVQEVEETELKSLRDQLKIVLDDNSPVEEKYYKVPFQRVLKLVEKRKVLIKKGQAYVPHRHVMQLLEASYRAHLMAEVNKASKARVALEPAERDRILAFLDHVVENHDLDTQQNLDSIDLGSKLDRRQIHEVAQIHFPLCMRHLDEHLRDDHHLKFHGRWQYGLFIKQLGLTLEDALEFWKGEMSQSGKKVTLETWNKSRYAYNIRHYYGAEGKRTSYTAPSCNKIIMGPPPAPEQFHGCPFRHWNETQLRRELQKPRLHPAVAQGKQAALFGAKIELTPSQIDDTIKKAKDGFYTAACQQYFVLTHPTTHEESLFHNPVLYYAASKRYVEEQASKDAQAQPAIGSPSTPAQKTYVKVGSPDQASPKPEVKTEAATPAAAAPAGEEAMTEGSP